MRFLSALLLVFSGTASAYWGHQRGGARPSNRAPSFPSYRGHVYVVPNRGTYVAQAAPASGFHLWFHHSVKPAPIPQQSQRYTGQAGWVKPAPQGAAPARFSPPAVDQKGSMIAARQVLDMNKNAALVRRTVANPDFARTVQSLTTADSDRDGNFHWYNRSGVRVSHWYDRDHGRDWFGFYRGGASLWTVSWHDNFWWQEPRSGRWCVFWRDQWWWHAADGQVYVYLGDQFYQWQPTATSAILVPAPVQLVDKAPPPAPPEARAGFTPDQRTSGTETMVVSNRPEFNYSADGTRMVQVEGELLKAYLYDTTRLDSSGGNKFIKELGQGVTAVQFSDTSAGDPLRITLSMQEDYGAVKQVVLDADGNPVGARAPRPRTAPPVIYGAKGAPGFDAPAPAEQPPADSPFPDGN